MATQYNHVFFVFFRAVAVPNGPEIRKIKKLDLFKRYESISIQLNITDINDTRWIWPS